MTPLTLSITFALGLMVAHSGLWTGPAHAAELSPKEIMKKSEEARKLPEVSSRCKLVQLSGAGKEPKLKEFRWWKKLSSNQLDHKTLIRFIAPATVKGEGILILEKDQAENEVLLYLPAYKKIRRVENQQQTGKFMGSEFSYSDMATPHVEEHQYSGGKRESCPGPEHAQLQCHVIESKPASDSVRDRTGYSRTINWVRPDNFMVVRVDYFDLEGQASKRLQASQLKQVSPGKWMSHALVMENLKTGGRSDIAFSDVKVGSGLDDSLFTQQNLSRGE